MTLVNAGYRELSNKFLKRKIDSVFILGSIESKAVERMLKARGGKLLSLDEPSKGAPAMTPVKDARNDASSRQPRSTSP